MIKISNDRKKLSKNKNKRDLNALLEAEFKFPKAGFGENQPSDQNAEAEIHDQSESLLIESMTTLAEQQTHEIEGLLETIAEGGKPAILTEALRDLSFSECKKEEELKKLKKEIAELKANQRKTSDKLQQEMSNRGSANVKNANKKIKRRDEKIEEQETNKKN